ncbi:DUF2500 domain-containing protein [Sedimentibacter hydroxybenzoicus DSM 7310]|uniref:DUF2500 domain-containing protein n=1 Tax=Sedimentibacter hydroxybenzoicus DSM 7310 TaxID=1123245 RepID=A0A974BH03_SEDHY|nr:DUF2500 domain-containing protein [Sedimentibacter hydroxybenzoicus]NYB72530.1 DUF2500 domain-containing protein [Sedimentibacter hydroxybenzoicus DSM 7310]
MSPFYDPFVGFNIMSTLFPIMFFLVFGIIIFSAIKSLSVSMHNNKQPIIPVEAKIVTKRYDVSHLRHHHGDNMHHHSSSSTSYFATFEMPNGERMELKVPSNEFGMMVEGDSGTLQFQGTRFITSSISD